MIDLELHTEMNSQIPQELIKQRRRRSKSSLTTFVWLEIDYFWRLLCPYSPCAKCEAEKNENEIKFKEE